MGVVLRGRVIEANLLIKPLVLRGRANLLGNFKAIEILLILIINLLIIINSRVLCQRLEGERHRLPVGKTLNLQSETLTGNCEKVQRDKDSIL